MHHIATHLTCMLQNFIGHLLDEYWLKRCSQEHVLWSVYVISHKLQHWSSFSLARWTIVAVLLYYRCSVFVLGSLSQLFVGLTYHMFLTRKKERRWQNLQFGYRAVLDIGDTIASTDHPSTVWAGITNTWWVLMWVKWGSWMCPLFFGPRVGVILKLCFIFKDTNKWALC